MPPKPGLQQQTMDGFISRFSPDEWAHEQEQRRIQALAEAQASPSVQEIPQPSVQFVPAKRGPGRPRKPRQLVVDLTVKDIFPSSQGTDGPGGSGGAGQTGTDGTGKSSGTAAKPNAPSASPPSVVKVRRDWLHPALFLRIYRFVMNLSLSKSRHMYHLSF